MAIFYEASMKGELEFGQFFVSYIFESRCISSWPFWG